MHVLHLSTQCVAEPKQPREIESSGCQAVACALPYVQPFLTFRTLSLLLPCAGARTSRGKPVTAEIEVVQQLQNPAQAPQAEKKRQPTAQHTENTDTVSAAASMTCRLQADGYSQQADQTSTQNGELGTHQCAVAALQAELQPPKTAEADDTSAVAKLPDQALLEPAELEQQSLAQAKHQDLAQAERQIGDQAEQQSEVQDEQQAVSAERLDQQSAESAEQKLDAGCTQMAASQIAKEAELSSLQQLLKLCGQDVSGNMKQDDVMQSHIYMLAGRALFAMLLPIPNLAVKCVQEPHVPLFCVAICCAW